MKDFKGFLSTGSTWIKWKLFLNLKCTRKNQKIVEKSPSYTPVLTPIRRGRPNCQRKSHEQNGLCTCRQRKDYALFRELFVIESCLFASYLTSSWIMPSSEGTPTRIAAASSGSSWLALSEAKTSAVACKLRDQTSRRRGKCRTSKESLEIMLVGTTSSPISLADCISNNM